MGKNTHTETHTETHVPAHQAPAGAESKVILELQRMVRELTASNSMQASMLAALQREAETAARQNLGRVCKLGVTPGYGAGYWSRNTEERRRAQEHAEYLSEVFGQVDPAAAALMKIILGTGESEFEGDTIALLCSPAVSRGQHRDVGVSLLAVLLFFLKRTGRLSPELLSVHKRWETDVDRFAGIIFERIMDQPARSGDKQRLEELEGKIEAEVQRLASASAGGGGSASSAASSSSSPPAPIGVLDSKDLQDLRARALAINRPPMGLALKLLHPFYVELGRRWVAKLDGLPDRDGRKVDVRTAFDQLVSH